MDIYNKNKKENCQDLSNSREKKRFTKRVVEIFFSNFYFESQWKTFSLNFEIKILQNYVKLWSINL